MGSPTTTYTSTSLSGRGAVVSGAVGDRHRRNSSARSSAKRSRNDHPSATKYGDNCSLVHGAPKLTVAIPPYGVPCHPYYGLPAPLVRDAVLVTPHLYFPAHPDFHADVDGLEQGMRGIKLDGHGAAALMAHADALLSAPPSTPSSTLSDTDLSSPQSFVSMHLAGSESSYASDNREPGRQRSNSGGSFYRTKPCKFFHSNGMCVKGNRCNFIHDQSQARRPSQSPVVGSPPTSRRRRAAKRAQARAEEAEQRTNFYPITWRVIGGGVMMGGQREICPAFKAGICSDGPNCQLAHPLEEDEDLYELSDVSTPTSSYDPIEHFSPVSPVYLPYPFIHYQVPTPFPEVPEVSLPCPTIVEVQNVPGGSTVLDGDTLLPRQLDDDDALTADAPSEDNTLLSARTIERPVSTPPMAKPSTPSVERLFQAEASW
ncbi:zinc finger CCCH domain-containing protein [Phanerochaete sordida]|uniref:Zinc finger CCCH domain-containing protein n=1 Tax=Phanerochaete sordida TaxID=48140 RepID=A0A9P3GP44_9APHY|nr:zinc finger CCCH domain-containing protein [Phanerochaete sordida]